MNNDSIVSFESINTKKGLWIIIKNDYKLENTSYILINNNDAIVIDPATNTEKILEIIQTKNLNVQSLILTHGHWDHWLTAKPLCEKYKKNMFVHIDEKNNITNGAKRAKDWGYYVEDFILDNVEYVKWKSKDKIILGDFEFEVLLTPGHSPGSVCLKWENYVFSGDLVFSDSIGRTDLDGSSSLEMKKSLQLFLKTYDDNLTILPGHGARTKMHKAKKMLNEILKSNI